MSIYRLSFKNLKRRKLRSSLTMLGVIIGVIALVVLMGFGTGLKSYMVSQTETMGGDLTITNSSGGSGFMVSAGESYLSSDAVSKIKSMPQLYNVTEEVQFSSQLNNIPVIVMGTDDWSQIKIANGTRGVVISKSLADDLNYKIGSNITIRDQEATVTGITNQNELGMGAVILETPKAVSMNNNKVSYIFANVKGDPNIVKNEIEDTISGTTAITKSDFTKQIDDMMNGIMLFIGAIASVALLVGVISIVNIMLVNVSERTREIGVLKAIGFTEREILTSILSESGLLGLIAAIIGVIIAAILLEIGVIYISQLSGITNVSVISMLPLWLVAGVICGATLLSILAGLYPAWRASRLNVVEALRYE